MIAELECSGGIRTASLKSVFEKAETSEPAQGGDFDAKGQTFY
jgi:hypothetical protein